VLELAHRNPAWLVVGLDANAAGMAEVSRRAANRPDRGGAPNALFAVAAAEAPPGELLGRADLVAITFPWGSLLRGVLGGNGDVTAGVAALLCPGGELRILFSAEPRDGVTIGAFDQSAREEMAAAWLANGVEIDEVRAATSDEIGATRSTWGRRLATDPDRRTWLLTGRNR